MSQTIDSGTLFYVEFKNKIENRFSRSRDIGHLSWRNREKMTSFDNFFKFFFSYFKAPKDV